MQMQRMQPRIIGARYGGCRGLLRLRAGAGGAVYLGDDEDDKARQRRPALFTNPNTKHRLFLDEAIAHSKDAERLYASRSSRIEYCKSKGVDYENVLEYAHIMERLMSSLNDPRKHLIVTCDENGKVRIVIGNSNSKRGVKIVCPLCLDPMHRLSLCPNLPDELRPFVN
jgi:hypothetical protein